MKRLTCIMAAIVLPMFSTGIKAEGSYSTELHHTTQPLTEHRVLQFFEQYTSDFQNPSPELIKYYTPKSAVKLTMTYPWGPQQITINGEDFKSMLEHSLAIIKRNNQIGQYNDIQIDLQNSVAILTAKRTVANLCFTDDSYKLVMAQDPNGKITVREENITTDPVAITHCIQERDRQIRLAKRKGLKLDDNPGMFATSLY